MISCIPSALPQAQPSPSSHPCQGGTFIARYHHPGAVVSSGVHPWCCVFRGLGRRVTTRTSVTIVSVIQSVLTAPEMRCSPSGGLRADSLLGVSRVLSECSDGRADAGVGATGRKQLCGPTALLQLERLHQGCPAGPGEPSVWCNVMAADDSGLCFHSCGPRLDS